MAKVIPAQLAFLAIYNPSLGPTDDTFRKQVVFYYSREARARRKSSGKPDEASQAEEENEMLRRIGLAQGMVDFGKNFSEGEAVDAVETEKSRVVLHELEPDWWILASVDLTQLPAHPVHSPTQGSRREFADTEPAVEYSSREVSPAPLLLKQLQSAHSVFLLHHGVSLADLHSRLHSTKFCNLLDRFWTRFAASWDVLLHGNPAVDVHRGIKLAAGGELGMGVGEEEWGSGEREVFEDFASRTESLVDLIVSRFGEPAAAQNLDAEGAAKGAADQRHHPLEPWMGSGRHAAAADGVVFSGVGGVSRTSLRDVTEWMRWIYGSGEYTYGVRDNPASGRRRRRNRSRADPRTTVRPDPSGRGAIKMPSTQAVPEADRPFSPGIPPPVLSTVESSLDKATAAVDKQKQAEEPEAQSAKPGIADPEMWLKYLTLGYGSTWGARKTEAPTQPTASRSSSQQQPEQGGQSSQPPKMRNVNPTRPEVSELENRLRTQIYLENQGHFLIGLRGDLNEEEQPEPTDTDLASQQEDEELAELTSGTTMLRTVHVEVTKPLEMHLHEGSASSRQVSSESIPTIRKLQRLRVVVYVRRPFITLLLFHPRANALSLTSFYRNLHHYLAPLHKPLTSSTSPARVAARIAASSHPFTTYPGPPHPKPQPSPTSTAGLSADPATAATQRHPIFDLLFDPTALTLHTSIPNIPDPAPAGIPSAFVAPPPSLPGWSRVEALGVHGAVLALVGSARRRGAGEVESAAKTARGWWVVWMRVGIAGKGDDTAAATAEGSSDTATATAPAIKVGDHRPSDPSSTRTLASGNRSGGAAEAKVTVSTEGMLDVASTREAILVRRATDAGDLGMGFLGLGGSSAAASGGAGRLVEGVGVDARKYVEGLLSLGR